MQAAADPEQFRAAPQGRYHLGPCWLVWCWDATLCGSLVWGRPSEDEVRALVRLYEIQDALAPRFDVVTDSSRMSLVSPAAFAVVANHLLAARAVLLPRIRKNALVMPAGLIGAAIAGLYPLLGAQVDWKPVTSPREAFEWLDTGAARAAWPEVERLAASAGSRSATLHRLHDYLRRNLIDASIDAAAAALGTSRRSLQRALAGGETSFRDELHAARIDEAGRRLAETDDKLESLAAELGFASASHFGAAYLAATGETPGQFRARYRKTGA